MRRTARRPIGRGASSRAGRSAAILRARRRAGARQRGQGLVEFALVIPLFVFLLFGVIDFGFLFNAVLAMDYATRNAALIAAEAGNAAGADCVILAQVDADIEPPSDRTRIQRVRIFRADRVGNSVAAQVYTRSGSMTCTLPDGRTVSVPYTLASAGYPDIQRCNQVGGCPPLGRSELDTIGVAVEYLYRPKAPMNLLWLGVVLRLNGDDVVITKSNVMRMEPVL